MRIIAKSALIAFWKKKEYQDSEQPLRIWYQEASKADWNSPNEVKEQYGNASILKNNRVVFNIAGNKYRLIVSVNFEYKCMYVLSERINNMME